MQIQAENAGVAASRTSAVSFMSKFMTTLNDKEEMELVSYSKWQRDRLAKVSEVDARNRPSS